jgi:hypothetical protein
MADEPDPRWLEGCRAYLRLIAELQLDRQLRSRLDPSDIVQNVLTRFAGARERLRSKAMEQQLA